MPPAPATARREPPGVDLTAMARLFEAYEEVKQRRGVIDFEDVLLLTVGILDERDDIARAVRGQYRQFVVDEYQDVNDLQQRLLELWLGERNDLCVVGDPAQTIYSFTGASPRHLRRLPAALPGRQVVRLVRNYRSSPQIVALANTIVASGTQAARDGAVRLLAQGEAGPGRCSSRTPTTLPRRAAVAARVRAARRRRHPAG